MDHTPTFAAVLYLGTDARDRPRVHGLRPQSSDAGQARSQDPVERALRIELTADQQAAQGGRQSVAVHHGDSSVITLFFYLDCELDVAEGNDTLHVMLFLIRFALRVWYFMWGLMLKLPGMERVVALAIHFMTEHRGWVSLSSI